MGDWQRMGSSRKSSVPSGSLAQKLAASATDVARVFDAIAGYDHADPTSVDTPHTPSLPSLADGISGMTVGIPRAFYYEDVDPRVSLVEPFKAWLHLLLPGPYGFLRRIAGALGSR